MKNSNETTDADSNNINTKQVINVICLIVLVVSVFYFANFHNGLSEKNEVWGTFGDYFGGILNPVIAAFAFYLIAKTYELQKRELEATRSLLEVSTDAQKNQIKLAALTALLNSNLMRIDRINLDLDRINKSIDEQVSQVFLSQYHLVEKNIDECNCTLESLEKENNDLVEQIKSFLKEN